MNDPRCESARSNYSVAFFLGWFTLIIFPCKILQNSSQQLAWQLGDVVTLPSSVPRSPASPPKGTVIVQESEQNSIRAGAAHNVPLSTSLSGARNIQTLYKRIRGWNRLCILFIICIFSNFTKKKTAAHSSCLITLIFASGFLYFITMKHPGKSSSALPC